VSPSPRPLHSTLIPLSVSMSDRKPTFSPGEVDFEADVTHTTRTHSLLGAPFSILTATEEEEESELRERASEGRALEFGCAFVVVVHSPTHPLLLPSMWHAGRVFLSVALSRDRRVLLPGIGVVGPPAALRVAAVGRPERRGRRARAGRRGG